MWHLCGVLYYPIYTHAHTHTQAIMIPYASEREGVGRGGAKRYSDILFCCDKVNWSEVK